MWQPAHTHHVTTCPHPPCPAAGQPAVWPPWTCPRRSPRHSSGPSDTVNTKQSIMNWPFSAGENKQSIKHTKQSESKLSITSNYKLFRLMTSSVLQIEIINTNEVSLVFGFFKHHGNVCRVWKVGCCFYSLLYKLTLPSFFFYSFIHCLVLFPY